MNVLDEVQYITPEQAKQRICPMSIGSGAASSCYGADCMGWRWHYTGGRTVYWRENILTPDPEPHWVYVGENPYKDQFPNDKSGTYIEGPTKGYCGLTKKEKSK